MTNKQYEEKEMDSYKYWHISQMNNSYPYKQKPIYLFIDLIEREKKETHGEFYDSIKKIKLQLTYIYSKRNSRSSRVWKLHKIEKNEMKTTPPQKYYMYIHIHMNNESVMEFVA